MFKNLERLFHNIDKYSIQLFSFIWEFCILCLLYPVSNIILYRKRICLISERGDDARDNGYHMFKYYRIHNNEENVYYVISRRSEDLKNIIEFGNIIYYRSLKHYIYFFASSIRMSTHILGFTPNPNFYTKIYKIYKPRKRINVSLKHGITKDDIWQLYKKNSHLDLIIAGAYPEYKYMINKFGYDSNEIAYTGFARFDMLHDFVTKKQILVMPTWRKNLYGISNEKFVTSDYFLAWQNLLDDPLLIQYLENREIDLIFYPHYEIQRYLMNFTKKSTRIIISSKIDFDVQTLLKESIFLITDFSSVYFDFAYMKKPIIYYQFDANNFFDYHYKKGYFDYESMGFGEIALTHNQAVELIISYFESNFIIKNRYLERIDRFFPVSDTHNCERIAKAVNESYVRHKALKPHSTHIPWKYFL